ncbi:AI-2E family transporter [Limosilactobacillus sp. STM2_1]|uniref:AI-2E family transporter n=1 Tax=Limosilactobacillus rudii TaxID=2759755 RepID=A0A7W3UKU9_9LACO|nr:AI-2E family transporter [Limosilactobacillus rudii]MBB1079383.1 AI-2E family transporter [Limosilactobacillus rudii]MBB1097429.1 AI-2E family transporter [Limosilactobacillus rudii]MCD7134538.1 AI-2E family transporter [Limosilactobacillus rudii]
MKQLINQRHFSLLLTLFILYLGITYWNIIAKFIQTVFSATIPLLIGCLIAYIVNLLLRQYEKLYSSIFRKATGKKGKRLFGIVMAYLTIIVIITVVFALVIPELVSCIKLLVANHSHVINHFIDYFQHNNDFKNLITSFDTSKIQWDKVGKYLTSGVGGTFRTVVSTASSIFSTATTVIIAFFFSIYLLIYKEMLHRQFTKILNTYFKKYNSQIIKVLRVFDESYSNYIAGQCKDAAILGISCFIGMTILRMPYASMIGVVTAFGALIPIIGAILGASIGVIIIFAISPLQAGIFLIFIILLQQLDNRITYPLVVGKSIGLPSVWVFAAVIIGGGISGILGMMFTVPFFAAIYKLIKADTAKRNTTSK